jgi:hypothetical protein
MPLTSGELTKLIADLTGVPMRTVALHLRNLRVAGLISTGARGVHAAHMTAADAASLLIAATLSDLVLQSVETVRTAYSLYESLAPRSGKESYSLDYYVDHVSPAARFANHCRGLLSATTFAQAVENLIDALGQPEKLRLVVETGPGGHPEFITPGISVLAKMVLEEGKYVLLSANIVLSYAAEFKITGEYVIPRNKYSRLRDRYFHLSRIQVLDAFPLMELGKALVSAKSETSS